MALSVVVALPIGLAIREADRRELGGPPPVRAPRRRRIPLPPVAVVLAGPGVTLEALGFVLRAAGADRMGIGRAFSMDLPLSVPRMYVTALFAAAALAAFTGAGRTPGRRTWWAAVGLVAAVAAEVKGGGTVHVRVVKALGGAGHPGAVFVGSAVFVLAVLTGLWWLSRGERRDRRRVLAALGLYGLAAGGLSSVSSAVAQQLGGGSPWSAATTFVEESGEVLGAVAVLVAVLIGVAPRLVLPADWALRRTADAETIDAPGVVPGWATDIRDVRR
jgi:hypothetical protein